MPAHIAMQYTATPESAHAIFGGEVPVEMALHETAQGGIIIDLRLSEHAGQGIGLATLAFDFADRDLLGGLSMRGAGLRGQNIAAGRVRAGPGDARGYDCGARFGRRASLGVAAPREVALTLDHDSLALTLEDLAGRDFTLYLVPLAANHAPCADLVIEGRFPAPPGPRRRGPAPSDGSIFGGVLADILPLLAREGR